MLFLLNDKLSITTTPKWLLFDFIVFYAKEICIFHI